MMDHAMQRSMETSSSPCHVISDVLKGTIQKMPNKIQTVPKEIPIDSPVPNRFPTKKNVIL